MKRFSRLEFGDRNGAGKKKADGQNIRDEEYFRDQAVRFWLAGDFELALRNYSRALERNSMLFEAWLGQVLMLIELGEYPEAMVWADKAMELFPEHPNLLAAKAVACSRDGRREKALAYSDNSISKENAGSRVWLARSEVLLRRNSRVAQTCLSKAVAMASQDSAHIRLEAGRLLNRTASHGAAIEYLNAAVEALPKSALAWYELGCCQARLGRAEAEAAFEHALKLRPDWEQARTALRRFKKRGILRKIFRI